MQVSRGKRGAEKRKPPGAPCYRKLQIEFTKKKTKRKSHSKGLFFFVNSNNLQ
jgi:hypothetical protein